jgi:hypothetical protein
MQQSRGHGRGTRAPGRGDHGMSACARTGVLLTVAGPRYGRGCGGKRRPHEPRPGARSGKRGVQMSDHRDVAARRPHHGPYQDCEYRLCPRSARPEQCEQLRGRVRRDVYGIDQSLALRRSCLRSGSLLLSSGCCLTIHCDHTPVKGELVAIQEAA